MQHFEECECNVVRRRNAADETGGLYFVYMLEERADIFTQGVHRGEGICKRSSPR